MTYTTVFGWSRIFCKLLNLLLNFLVKTKSIPTDPTIELGLDVSRPITYIMPCNSKIDLLTLRVQCLKHHLPDPLEPLIIGDLKFPRTIFINSKQHIFTFSCLREELIKLFYHYLDLHLVNPNLDMQIIPVFVMFGRRPICEVENTNKPLHLFNRFLDGIKKFLAITWFGRDSFIRFFPFVSFRWMVNVYNTDKTIANKLVRVARMHFTRHRLVTTGPRLPSRQNLFSKLLSSKAVIRAIEDEARIKKISSKKAKKSAILLLEEIAANFSYEMVRLTDRILGFTWNYLYQKINVHNVECVQQLAYEGHEIVYIPCHRSHMDYLLLSYVLYHQGLAPPHIAAGINLNFWPAGPIFRRLGAFFIRRTFKNNKLYSTVFREYLVELFTCGCSIEFFLEGGRSRTGRLLDPKTGTLSMTIQAMLRGGTRPITLVPIYIGYEHIIEVCSYAKELKGAVKEKESLLKIFRGLSKLRNLGQCYVNFGEPLLLMTWLDQHVLDWRKSIDSMESIRPTWITPTANNIAADLMVRINNASATNAVNLCCTALLASNQHSLTRKQLTELLDCYLNIIRNVPYSVYSTVPTVSTSTLIDYALKMDKFEIKKDNTGDVILIREQTTLLTYYRNNIMHMLVLPFLVAAIIIQKCYISRQQLLDHVNTIYPVLKAELFLRWSCNELDLELDKIINELWRQELILVKNDNLQVNPLSLYTLQLLAAGIKETIQRYAITFWILSSNPSINRGSLEKESWILAQRLSLIYDIKALEFFDKAVFSTLVLILRNEGYISNDKNTKQKETMKVYRILSELLTSEVRSIIESSHERYLTVRYISTTCY